MLRFEGYGLRVEGGGLWVEGRGWRVEGGRSRVEGQSVKRFRGGLVFKAHRLLYHSTLGSRVIKKNKQVEGLPGGRRGQ